MTLRLPEDSDTIIERSAVHRPDGLTVACYTFPHFHRSALNDKVYGAGWTEYTLMHGTRPWFEGHHQPRTPMLGDLDERHPATWEKYVDLAVEGGIDTFIWDAYWYGGEPVFHEALEEGFLHARGRERMKFAVMWTNHPWYYWYPTRSLPPIKDGQGMFGTAGLGSREFLYGAPDSPEEVWRSLTYLISRYIHDPYYWCLNGRPVLVIWNALRLFQTFGIAGTRTVLDELRAFGRKLGHEPIHFHATQGSIDVFADLEAAGFDSYGIYTPIPNAAAERPDEEDLIEYGVVAADTVTKLWPRYEAQSTLPFFPGIGPGWDNTPRCFTPARPVQPSRKQWPFTELVVNETPEAFELLTRGALAYLNQHPTVPPVVTIGCWNEWTEGQYLLPDTKHGFGMLRALARGLHP